MTSSIPRNEPRNSSSAIGEPKRLRTISTSTTAYRIASYVHANPLHRSHIVLCPTVSELEQLALEIRYFVGSESPVLCFPPWDILPFEPLSPTVEVSGERLRTLAALLNTPQYILLTTPDAVCQKVISPSVLRHQIHTIAIGEDLDRDELVRRLDNVGYVRTSLAEESGQMAVRGAVLDLFPSGQGSAVRVEFVGSRIDSIRHFDPTSQRSTQELQSFAIIPVSEVFLGEVDLHRAERIVAERGHELNTPTRTVQSTIDSLANGIRFPGLEQFMAALGVTVSSLNAYLTDSTTISVVEELEIHRVLDSFESLVKEREALAINDGRLIPRIDELYISVNEIEQEFLSRANLSFNQVELFALNQEVQAVSGDLQGNGKLAELLSISRKSPVPLEPLVSSIRAQLRSGTSVAITVSSKIRAGRMAETLEGYEIQPVMFEGSFPEWRKLCAQHSATKCYILLGYLKNGFTAVGEHFQIIAEGEIFPGAPTKKPASSQTRLRKIIGGVSQYAEGDYVVHVDRGIALYRGLKQLVVEGAVSDFLYLEYAEGAKLFVPVENIGKIQKYIGAEGQAPALTRLGGKVWERSKEKVKNQVAELAGQLVSLYAARDILPGFAFGDLDAEDRMFAETFAYVETPDQQRAIDEVLADMGASKPMDRLVCGDVGYGKTEVALRAAFKAVQSGKQVAVLVPTTILAEQHYSTFSERFSTYPFVVGCVSRFVSSQQNRETLVRTAQGKVDILIGTHRLLQKDVFFKDLGLVIIDEEHRFGVAHKEKLKRYRREVDVLTLTATPIPRTLHMSLLGIRDLSVIETPPTDRHVIRTFIAPYNEAVVREAILREKARGGQCFYIHNRVANIAAVAQELMDTVPEVRVAFAHGQMREGDLEKVMHQFIAKEIDVLVSTTIVESGLDIPNANTIIVRQADMFGLAELYQLRGRVGRSTRRAYAYLFISDPKSIGAEAKKRLAVLQSLDDLGVGFRLALQDMEIRGAGNLLGKDQSGEVNEVGFELYSQILKDAVARVRADGEGSGDHALRVDPEISIGFPAHIPQEYIPDVGERLILYQRLVDLESEEQARELAEEIEDRFGNPPVDVTVLIEVMNFRVLLKRAAILNASYRGDVLSLTFHPKLDLDVAQIVRVVQGSDGLLQVSPQGLVRIQVPHQTVKSPADLHEIAEKWLLAIGCSV